MFKNADVLGPVCFC